MRGPDPTGDSVGLRGAGIFAALLAEGEPALRRAKGPIAVNEHEGKWYQHRRSHYKVHRDDDQADLLFNVYTRESGRGMWEESRDVVVHYEDGVPTAVYTASVALGGEFTTETLYSLHWGEDGLLERVEQVRAERSHHNSEATHFEYTPA